MPAERDLGEVAVVPVVGAALALGRALRGRAVVEEEAALGAAGRAAHQRLRVLGTAPLRLDVAGDRHALVAVALAALVALEALGHLRLAAAGLAKVRGLHPTGRVVRVAVGDPHRAAAVAALVVAVGVGGGLERGEDGLIREVGAGTELRSPVVVSALGLAEVHQQQAGLVGLAARERAGVASGLAPQVLGAPRRHVPGWHGVRRAAAMAPLRGRGLIPRGTSNSRVAVCRVARGVARPYAERVGAVGEVVRPAGRSRRPSTGRSSACRCRSSTRMRPSRPSRRTRTWAGLADRAGGAGVHRHRRGPECRR